MRSLGRAGWEQRPPRGGAGAASLPSLRRCGDMSGDMRALLCLWLVAQVAQVAQVALSSRLRTRRELGPGLYQHGVYDAGGSYCQRGDVCCRGRDDACTVPYHDTLCYCDLFCNRTVSDCCPDFWEYCLGIPAPFPKAPGEARRGRWEMLLLLLGAMDAAPLAAELLRTPQSRGKSCRMSWMGMDSLKKRCGSRPGAQIPLPWEAAAPAAPAGGAGT